MATKAGYPEYKQVDLEKGGTLFDDDDVHDVAEQALRLGFIRKVFGILSAQLVLTAAIATPIVLSQSVKLVLASYPAITVVSMLVSLVTLLVLTFSESARHSHPTNLWLLATFTAAEGVLVGAISSQYNLASIVLAVMITAGVTVGLSLYALRTKKDFTMQGGLLMTLLLTLIFTSLVGAFMRSPVLDLMIAGGGALLFGAYIVFDVQMLAGGKHTTHKLSPDEYVVGAITIYLDVINLFIYILRLLDDRR